MKEIEQKKKASMIVREAMTKTRGEKIDPYIAIGAFIDEVIRELSKQNDFLSVVILGVFLNTVNIRFKAFLLLTNI